MLLADFRSVVISISTSSIFLSSELLIALAIKAMLAFFTFSSINTELFLICKLLRLALSNLLNIA